MTPTGFQVVYDVTKDGWAVLLVPAWGIGFILIGCILPRLTRHKVLRSPKWIQNWFPAVWLGFASLWTLVAFISVGSNFWTDYSVLSSGHAQFIEGPVENFVPMPVTGHALEWFDVKGVQFSYSDYVVTPGFNHTSSHGGPIREGLYVRIWYRGNDILKLETPRASP